MVADQESKGAMRVVDFASLLTDVDRTDPEVQVSTFRRISDIAVAGWAVEWDALEHGASPFLRYGFLLALEESGSIGPGTGWYPVVIVAEKKGRLLGAIVAFIKSHSYGEYIFDWSWAEASQRAGIPYYPKLVIAAPMSPVTGNRILLAKDKGASVCEDLILGVREVADEIGAWSVHWLFNTAKESEILEQYGFAPRASLQYHWHNDSYSSFDDFLDTLRSRRRKQFRKERKKVHAVVDKVRFFSGHEISSEQLACIDRFYRQTNECHGSIDYLRPGFFQLLATYLPDNFLYAEVRKNDAPIAGALYLESEGGLYGRYWGCDEEIPFLHFETAFYAGIERCIERETPVFEAGAQGEQKLLRGFEPTVTHSNHWLRHPGLSDGVNQFLKIEADEVRARVEELRTYGPYKMD